MMRYFSGSVYYQADNFPLSRHLFFYLQASHEIILMKIYM